MSHRCDHRPTTYDVALNMGYHGNDRCVSPSDRPSRAVSQKVSGSNSQRLGLEREDRRTVNQTNPGRGLDRDRENMVMILEMMLGIKLTTSGRSVIAWSLEV